MAIADAQVGSRNEDAASIGNFYGARCLTTRVFFAIIEFCSLYRPGQFLRMFLRTVNGYGDLSNSEREP